MLHLPGNKTFTVIAENFSAEHKYVDSIFLNGKKYEKKSISHEEILKGGELLFKMR